MFLPVPRAMYMEGVSVYPGERELLLGRDLPYVVERAEQGRSAADRLLVRGQRGAGLGANTLGQLRRPDDGPLRPQPEHQPAGPRQVRGAQRDQPVLAGLSADLL